MSAWWGGYARGYGRGRGRGAATATGPTITAPGSLDVSTYKIGTEHTITEGTATATGGGTVSYEYRWLVAAAEAATTAAYTPLAVDDEDSIAAQWRAVETGGTNAGATAWQTVGSGTVTYAAPSAAAGIADQNWTEDSAITALDVGADFTNDTGGVYSVQTGPLPAGLSLATDTGIISGTPTEVVAGRAIVIRYTNSGGTADSGFQVTVAAAAGAGAADYVVTNDSEWNNTLALGAATLAGKTMEISGSNFTRRSIADLAPATAFTIRSADSASKIPGIDLTGVCSNITIACNLQMTVWPRSHRGVVEYGTGTFTNIIYDGASFRHGYGAGNADFDRTFEYPEYDRVDNVQTAGATSGTFALTWKDAAATGGWSEFFNRDATNGVYVKFGGAGVTATTADTLVPANSRTRFTPLNPTTDTHVAILAQAGTPQINARTEVGMSYYLAAAFFSSGSATHDKFTVKNCTFSDLNNGAKGITPTGEVVVLDNVFRRIYQDIISFSAPGPVYVMRNLAEAPFAKSGIAEAEDGDAKDPHGDYFQMFGSGIATVGPVYSAGNRTLKPTSRANCISQGLFWSDNDFTPSYDKVFSINDAMLGGATNAVVTGETSFPADGVMIFGSTFIDGADRAGRLSAVRLASAAGYAAYVGKTIAQNNANDGEVEPAVHDSFVLTSQTANVALALPNWTDVPSATTRAAIETAMTTAAEMDGLGASANTNVVDWNTTDHTAIILWANIPSGVEWADLTEQTIGAVVTTDLRRVLNRKTGQTVVPGPGVEWRSVDTDKTTEVTAWTTASGTIEPDQFIQIRFTPAASGQTETTHTITINGFAQTLSCTTTVAPPETFLVTANDGTNGNTIFKDPAAVPTGTTRITFTGKFKFPSDMVNDAVLFTQESLVCELRRGPSGHSWLEVQVENQAGTAVVISTQFNAGLTTTNWHDIEFDANHATQSWSVTVDGTVVGSGAMSGGANTDHFGQAVREIIFLGRSETSFPVPTGTGVADLSVAFNGTTHKTISNDAATANADTWQLGSDCTQGV